MDSRGLDAVRRAGRAHRERMMSWKLLKDFRPDGHAYYADGRGRVAIADCSGKLPEDTDDGVLYLDYDDPLVVSKASLPLKGNESTPVGGKEIAWLLTSLQLKVTGDSDE